MTAYLRPTSLDEALALRAAHPDYAVVAGGTDLLVGALERPAPAGVLDVFGVAELVGITPGPREALTVGAATPYARLLESPRIRTTLPMLHTCVREIGAAQIQARGTLGGNAQTCSPVGDTLPVLLALEAEVELANQAGRRRLPFAEFVTGYRQTALAADELIVAFHFPAGLSRLRQHWRKVGTRRAQAISKVMLAAVASLDDGTIASPRVAFGAVADRPLRIQSVEAALAGRPPSLGLADEAAALLEQAITPISDVRSSADYRLQVAKNMLHRWVASLVD
ncbi:MAG: xanthine dehydrogenase family protein subunit M [Planctomycetes bacterium]|nr:xanthine dehydrogenase family protein subunit M [Planctomycetota bacterium]